jgi:hypothetical protein
MLIPIGQEDATVRRHPWVTYALLAANTLFFLVTSATGPGVAWRHAVMSKIDEMVTYFNARPYLELPPDLAVLCRDAECQAEVEAQRKAFARRSTIPDGSVVAEQQRRLDEMGRELHSLRTSCPRAASATCPPRASSTARSARCSFTASGSTSSATCCSCG